MSTNYDVETSTSRPDPDMSRNPEGPAHLSPHDLEEHGIPKNMPRPAGWRVALALIGFVVLLVALFLVGWFPHHNAEKLVSSDAAEIASDLPVVSVVTPKQTTPVLELVLPCDVKANQETAIFPRATGYLKKLNVDIQDHVEKDQVLAEIDTPEVDAQLDASKAALRQAEAGVAKAQTDIDLAQTTLDRYTVAQKDNKGAVAQQDIDTRQSTLEQAKASMLQAQANVAAAQADVQRLTVQKGFEKVTAPFAGVITARHYDLGALLSASNSAPGTEMFSLAQVDTLRVNVNVPQAQAVLVKLGDPVTLVVRNYPARKFVGSVWRSAGAMDPVSRTLRFELLFPNKDGALYAGMYGVVHLPMAADHSALIIPSSAMIFNAAGVRVALVKDNKVSFQKVSIGRDLGDSLEITDGLTMSDRVISNPGQKIVEGGEVTIATTEKPVETATAPAK